MKNIKACKYCVDGPVIVKYDKAEAKLYSEHLRHKYPELATPLPKKKR